MIVSLGLTTKEWIAMDPTAANIHIVEVPVMWDRKYDNKRILETAVILKTVECQSPELY
jgi:hypothetical protein